MPAERDSGQHPFWYSYIPLTFWVLGFAFCIFVPRSEDALFVSVLLGLPLIPYLILSHTRDRRLPGKMAFLLSLCGMYVAWVLWSASEISDEGHRLWVHPTLYHGSYFLLLGASLLMVGVFRLTWRLMQAIGDDQSGDDVEGALRSNGMLTLSSFLAIFMIVTFLLAFSLAFHDKANVGWQLYASGIPSGSTADDESVERRSSGKVGSDHEVQAEAPAEQPNTENDTWWIAFEKGHARVEERTDLCNISVEQLRKDHAEDLEILREVLRLRTNALALAGAAAFVNGRTDHERMQITLRGHASNAAVEVSNPDYRSNYELSFARVKQVEQRLRAEIGKVGKRNTRWHNIEWVLIPLSNEGTPEPDRQDLVEELDEHLTVEMTVAEVPHASRLQSQLSEPRVMGLLDYLYFTIYTITTTGYGDIVPVSSFAKWVTSLANLFELFFLVVFLNVLLTVMLDKYQRLLQPRLVSSPRSESKVRATERGNP